MQIDWNKVSEIIFSNFVSGGILLGISYMMYILGRRQGEEQTNAEMKQREQHHLEEVALLKEQFKEQLTTQQNFQRTLLRDTGSLWHEFKMWREEENRRLKKRA